MSDFFIIIIRSFSRRDEREVLFRTPGLGFPPRSGSSLTRFSPGREELPVSLRGTSFLLRVVFPPLGLSKKQEKEAAKRPWTSAAPGPKKLKIVSEVTPDEMEKMVKSKTVEKLNMDFLKSFLKSLGSTVTGKKKAQLVQEVYDYFSAADFCD